MTRTNILKCSKVLYTCSRNNQRTHVPILARGAINQENTPPLRNIKKETSKSTLEKEDKREDITPPIKAKELDIWDRSISKLYNDDCAHFSIRSRSGNEYIMIAYNCDSNNTPQASFINRKYKHRIRAYNSIMRRLANR